MELKQGYKQTEIGVIPDDWEIQTGEQITTLIGKGASPRWQGFEYTSSGMLFVTSENVRDGFLDIHEPKFLPLAFHEKLKRTQLQKYDILINLVGASIGRSCQILDEIGEANINQAVAVFRVKEQFDSAFIACYFQAPTTVKRILDMQVDAARPNISLGGLRRFLIPLPARAEQQAIAAALSDVDALMTALDRLIAKKRDIKQAVMQELLTGKRRLPGFTGEWVSKVLKTVTQIPVTDGPHLTPRFLQEGIPFLSVNNLVDNKIDLSDLRYVSKEDHAVFSKKCKPQKDDILLGKAASVGKVAIVDFDFEFNIWSPLALIRVNENAVPKFIYYCLQGQSVTRQIEILTNSSSQGNIGMGDIERLVLLLPSREEQRAIADILSDMDAEIAALERKRDKTRLLKQGMMQELLTGKTRLV